MEDVKFTGMRPFVVETLSCRCPVKGKRLGRAWSVLSLSEMKLFLKIPIGCVNVTVNIGKTSGFLLFCRSFGGLVTK